MRNFKLSNLEPKQIQNILITIITTLSAAIVLFVEFDRVKAVLLPENKILNPVLITVILILTNFITFLIMYSFLHKAKRNTKNTARDLDNALKQLADKKRLEVIDVITGIPNEVKFKQDVKKLTSELYQLILIDLDKFTDINKKYTHLKGDELIRYIAQNLYTGMRRDEEIYKRDTIPHKSILKRIYRKYKAGDEFIFLVKGEQHDAVGFLTRIHKEFERFSEKTEGILGTHVKLNFHGAISPFYANEEFDQAYKRLHDSFTLAAENKNQRRVFWYADEETLFPEKDFRHGIYQRAIKAFSL